MRNHAVTTQPVGAPSPRPRRLIEDVGAVELVGSVDGLSATQFRRLLRMLPPEQPLVPDLAGAELVAHGALVALVHATAGRQVVVRNARRIVQQL